METGRKTQAAMKTIPVIKNPCRCWGRLSLFSTVSALCLFNLLSAAVSLAQDAASVEGLGKGERDTMRLESRMEGREERILDVRVNDQKIGYEERKIRLERRDDERLRAEEALRDREERFEQEEEKARERARKREAENVRRKKRTVDILPHF